MLMLFGNSNQRKTHEAEKRYNYLEKNQNSLFAGNICKRNLIKSTENLIG